MQTFFLQNLVSEFVMGTGTERIIKMSSLPSDGADMYYVAGKTGWKNVGQKWSLHCDTLDKYLTYINDQGSNLEECIDNSFCPAVHISFWSGSLQFVN